MTENQWPPEGSPSAHEASTPEDAESLGTAKAKTPKARTPGPTAPAQRTASSSMTPHQEASNPRPARPCRRRLYCCRAPTPLPPDSPVSLRPQARRRELLPALRPTSLPMSATLWTPPTGGKTRSPDTRLADDPLAGKEPADDPLGSDPLTLDRSNPGTPARVAARSDEQHPPRLTPSRMKSRRSEQRGPAA